MHGMKTVSAPPRPTHFMISFVLFDINMDAGHGGSSGRFSHLEDAGKILCFCHCGRYSGQNPPQIKHV
jgi:protease II